MAMLTLVPGGSIVPAAGVRPVALPGHADPALVADQAVLDDRELRELPVHVHPDIPHRPASLH
jgi:hypothetical protein